MSKGSLRTVAGERAGCCLLSPLHRQLGFCCHHCSWVLWLFPSRAHNSDSKVLAA